ncbi:MAG: hypothetical protein AABX38_04960 [Candidatus Micrarchaeota archaeon]
MSTPVLKLKPKIRPTREQIEVAQRRREWEKYSLCGNRSDVLSGIPGTREFMGKIRYLKFYY